MSSSTLSILILFSLFYYSKAGWAMSNIYSDSSCSSLKQSGGYATMYCIQQSTSSSFGQSNSMYYFCNNAGKEKEVLCFFVGSKLIILGQTVVKYFSDSNCVNFLGNGSPWSSACTSSTRSVCTNADSLSTVLPGKFDAL